MRFPIIFIDSGDTIVNEVTEIRDEHEDVIYAELIPGGAELIRTLHEEGYTVIMVADGTRNSFENVYHQHDLYDCYDARIYSEDLGTHKPDARMFEEAMKHVPGVPPSEILMVGNNLSRDILGANRMGIHSVLINWSGRYPATTEDPEAQPEYTIHAPLELLQIVHSWGAGVRPR